MLTARRPAPRLPFASQRTNPASEDRQGCRACHKKESSRWPCTPLHAGRRIRLHKHIPLGLGHHHHHRRCLRALPRAPTLLLPSLPRTSACHECTPIARTCQHEEGPASCIVLAAGMGPCLQYGCWASCSAPCRRCCPALAQLPAVAEALLQRACSNIWGEKWPSLAKSVRQWCGSRRFSVGGVGAQGGGRAAGASLHPSCCGPAATVQQEGPPQPRTAALRSPRCCLLGQGHAAGSGSPTRMPAMSHATHAMIS